MKSKREPTFADQMIGGKTSPWNAKADEAARQRLMLAKKFTIDHAAAKYIGELIRRAPRIIADAQDFAIPPFENMWIEFPFDTLFYTVNDLPHGTVVTSSGGITGPVDSKMGFLITGGHHIRVGVADDRGHAAWTATEYLIHRPWTREEEMEFRAKYKFSGLTIDDFFWGTSSRDLLNAGSHESIRALRAEHSLRIIEPDVLHNTRRDPDRVRDIMARAILESAGDLRNIIAILLFLNRTREEQTIREVGPSQGFIGNKLRPLYSHSVITLKVDPVEHMIRRLVAGHGATKRLHDVRGHFCHNERARTAPCAHEWEETDWMPNRIDSGARVPRQWKCIRCTGLRWWKKEHERGHEEKGIVTSEYQVTKD